MAAPARVVTIPSADADLAAEADRIAARIPADLSPSDALAWYRLAIRRVYPSSVVREQDDLARVEGQVPVWYVMRREHHFRIDTAVWVPLASRDAWHTYVDRVTEWQVSVELEARGRSRAFIGREYDATYTFLGRPYHGLFRILAADPGRFVSIEASGSGVTVWYVTSFTDERDGTLVHVKGDYELPDNILTRIADRLGVERAIGRDIQRANESYRSLCATVARGEG